MGAVLARIRGADKRPDFDEVTKEMEAIDEQMQVVAASRDAWTAHRRSLSWRILLWALFMELVFILWAWFQFMPFYRGRRDWYLEHASLLAHVAPMLVLPVVALLVRAFVNTFFNAIISRKIVKLGQLKADQNKKMAELKSSIDYEKVQKMLRTVEMFDAKLKGKPVPQPKPAPKPASVAPGAPLSRPTQDRRPDRPVTTGTSTMSGLPAVASVASVARPPIYAAHRRPASSPALAPAAATASAGPAEAPSTIGWLMDWLVGDTPDQTFALICQSCGSNNGMAPKEEQENFQFSCRACAAFNELKSDIKPSGIEAELTAAIVQQARQEAAAPAAMQAPVVCEADTAAPASAAAPAGDRGSVLASSGDKTKVD